MNTHTHLEDLSNEIFFEIFDYLEALEIFSAFTSLNQRISSILQIISLRIVISNNHCRSQIEYLSSHLTYHDYQVISIDTCDTVRDCSSVISLLFNRHNFINLQLCVLTSDKQSTKLRNVLKKIKSLTRLTSFSIYQSSDVDINGKDKYELAQMIFMNQSSSLRSIVLSYNYDYLDITNYSSIATYLISLNLCIAGLSSTVSIYSIFSILRFCHTVRYLSISITYMNKSDDEHISDRIRIPSLNQNDLPILQQVIHLNLMVLVICDKRAISYILRCVPNLTRFYFTLGTQSAAWPFPDELLDGYVWQEMVDRYVPHLTKFEFHMSIKKAYQSLDIDMIVNSFEIFVRKYSKWNMVICYWKSLHPMAGEHVMLRTFNYRQHNPGIHIFIPIIHCETFQTRSTSTKNDHHLFYSNIEDLTLYITEQQPTITWSAPLFRQITNLTIEMPMISSSIWHNLLNIDELRLEIFKNILIVLANYGAVNDDNDTQEIIPHITQFVYLHNITHIKFESMIHISRWIDVRLILQACLNVTNLTINTQLLLLSKLIDNPSLFQIFERIKMIELVRNGTYFPPSSASKIAERFPSLNHIELPVFSFDYCVPVIDVFLSDVKDLSYMKINYSQDTLLDDPFSRDYLIRKRRQAFPKNIIDEKKVAVNNTGDATEIWLS